MIEAREVTYDWASTPNASVSQKKYNGVPVGTNWVKNPNANGSTSSFSGAAASAYTGGTRARAYKGTATSVNASTFGLTTADQPSAASGDTWWAHALVQADSTVYGARKVTLTCRFRDAPGGNILGSFTTSQDIIPTGVFHRWTGVNPVSVSEEYSGTTKRTNRAVDPQVVDKTQHDSLNFTPSTASETYNGHNFLRYTRTSTASSAVYLLHWGPPSVTPGLAINTQVMIRASFSGTVTAQFSFFNTASATLVVGTTDIAVSPGVWVPVALAGTVPDTATGVQVNLLSPLGAVNDTLDITELIVENGGVSGAYFDGSTPNTGTGNNPNVFELAVEGVAPPGTQAVEVAITRNSSYSPVSGDIIWFTDVALIQPNSETPKAYFDGDSPDSTEYVYVERPGEITTDEWLEVDGVPLNTLAWNITTWGGSRQGPPGVRGANITVPGRPGAVFKNKELDTQTYTLNMWVQGSLADGSRPDDLSAQHQYDKNWSMLRKLLFTTRTLLKVTKRWFDPDAKAIRSATGYAQYNGGLEPSMTGRARSVFSVDLLFNDPFFYESTRELDVATTQNKTWVETVTGDWRTTAIKVSMVGARTNPKITVTHPDGSQTWMQYNGTVAAGDTLMIDVDTFSAQLTSGTTTRQVSGRITHGGAAPWLTLEPGDNIVALTSNNGTGPVSLAYDAVWF